jgi:predicted amidophosphoribosyltransferase
MAEPLKAWVCPRCHCALAAGALRCKQCGVPFAGKAAHDPHKLKLEVRDSRLKRGGISVSFGVDFEESDDES